MEDCTVDNERTGVRKDIIYICGVQYDGIVRIQPQLLLPSGTRADFWDGMFKRSEAQRQIVYSELGDDPMPFSDESVE